MDYETPLFFHVMAYAANADRDVVDMVSGNPDWEPPEALRDGLREYADFPADRLQYAPSAGLADLREAIAERRGVARSQVVITNGGGEANYLAMARALERGVGDEVILTDPVYPYYPGKTTMLGGVKRFVSAGGGEAPGRLDPDAVRAVASADTAAIVVNSPNNPTGAVYPKSTVRELVAVAEEHDALLISDEVYDHYDLSGDFFSALHVDSGNRIVTNSVSKTFAATGLRVGYAVFPEPLVENAKSRHMLVNVATTRPGQYAALRAFEETDPAYHEANRELLCDRVDEFTDALAAAGAEYTVPDGAFYVMSRFEGVPGTLENVETLIDEAGVAGMPGAAFGDSAADWFRFALVTPRLSTAAERLAEHFG
jgi:aspartate/methionine/tyrosine aminotransferase